MAPSEQWPPGQPLDPASSGAAAAAEQWVVECCRVEVDSDGNVVTPLPALMAAAVGQLVEEAAAADSAAHPAPPRQQPTRLHGCRPPAISVEDYAARLLRYCKNSPVCYAAAFAYMLRLHRGCTGVRGGRVRVDTLTAHRMMAVGSVVACKFYDDKASRAWDQRRLQAACMQRPGSLGLPGSRPPPTSPTTTTRILMLPPADPLPPAAAACPACSSSATTTTPRWPG
jgi:hypothetical protein